MRRIPVFWISSAFLLGIPLAAVIPVRTSVWKISFFVCLGLLLVEILARRKWSGLPKTVLPVFLLLAMLTSGGWRYAAVQQQPFSNHDLAYYNDGEKITISGVVCSDPRHLEKSIRFTFCADQVLRPSTAEISGKAMVVQRNGDWVYGDRLHLSGSVRTPDENEEFSYKDYLAQRGIYSLMEYPYVEFVEANQGGLIKTGLFRVRQKAYTLINDFLPQPEAGLLSGILLGMEDDIPTELETAYQNTGTAHVIAISGFNMAILAGIFLKSFRKYLSIWWAALLAVLVIGLYTVLVGGAPAVVRAALMSCLAMSASLIGRSQSGVYTLTLTAALMCLFNPLLLWAAGFQLSVMATLGLVLYADRLMDWFRDRAKKVLPEGIVERISGPVGDYFLFTLAAQVMTLPITLYHFGRLSFTTLLANPLILPVQPMIMILGGVAVLIGMLLQPIGQIVAYLVYVLLFYTNQVVSWLGAIPGGMIIPGDVTLITVLAMYVIIFFLAHRKKESGIFAQQKPILAIGLMVVAIFLTWNGVVHRTDGKLHIKILNEPNQGVVWVQTPSGKRMLINAGEHGNSLSSELNQNLSIFNRNIDLALASSDAAADLTAFPVVLERFRVGQFLWVDEIPSSKTATYVSQSLNEQQIDTQILTTGQIVDSGDGVRLENVDEKISGISLLLTYQDFHLVFLEQLPTGDEYNHLLEGAVVLLSPRLTMDYSEVTWRPQVLISHESNVKDTAGQTSTQNEGTIEIITDGNQMWFEGEK